MPCFKGIAVSLHANNAPLPEYGVQKQSRVSRINTYIPVPPPQLSPVFNKTEAAKFAISITLLTPGLPVPYSSPKPTESEPDPKPQYVGQPSTSDGGRYQGIVTPYMRLTDHENETIAAYIYFDGRPKEEVATLLRPGEETWVNSRWVQVPSSEGGGLAEREFLFREVGLEKWLNGLDLQGHDAAKQLEKRRQKYEKRRRRQRMLIEGIIQSPNSPDMSRGHDNTLRCGAEDKSTVDPIEDPDDLSDDDDLPEATGQIKVAMFRVLASGEIKKGEYSPQFDAHDDDDDKNSAKREEIDADVEHTTSFAKPKTLDPKTISTQTVTGIDGPDKPYAVFTFFYRGERQLQKMGVLTSSKPQEMTPAASKQRSGQLDFSSLGPLKTTGTVGFSSFREQRDSYRRRKQHKKCNGSLGIMEENDSEDDEEGDDDAIRKMEDAYFKFDKSKLGPEDARFSGELAEGVDRIKLKRAHSGEPESATGLRKSPSAGPGTSPPYDGTGVNAVYGASVDTIFGKSLPDHSTVGSPIKKARPSVGDGTGFGSEHGASAAVISDVIASAETLKTTEQAQAPAVKEEMEEEL